MTEGKGEVNLGERKEGDHGDKKDFKINQDPTLKKESNTKQKATM